MHEDLRREVQRGGAWGMLCRVLQPLVWLLTLPMSKPGVALLLAIMTVSFGAIA